MARSKYWLLSTALVGLMTAAPAWAQSSGETQAPQSDGDDAGVNDIVVTANKREQSLKDVGLTVTALSGEALVNQRVSNVADLAQLTPGLTYAPTPTNTPVYTLRGVGFFEPSLAAYPDVSLYVDQVPLPFPAMATHIAFDVERVEVLKGPQGTLFGNNATGGAINYIAAKPTAEFSAGVDLSYGRFNTMDVGGFVSGPLTDTLRARIAFKTVHGDDWQKSYTRIDGPSDPALVALGVPDNPGERQDTLGQVNHGSARLSLDWEPSSRLRASFILTGWYDKDDPLSPQKIASIAGNPIGTVSPFGFGTIFADTSPLFFPNAPENARATDWSPSIRPFADSKFWQAALRTDYDIFSDMTLTSLTSYSNLDFLNATESGGTSLIETDISRDKGDLSSFSQELRLANSPRNPLRWLVGANYEHSNVYEVIDYRYVDSTTFTVLNLARNRYDTDQKMRNYGLFGNLEYDILPNLTLKGGVRQTWANRSTVSRTYQPPGVNDPGAFGPNSLTNLFNVLVGAFCPGAPTIAEGEPVAIDFRTNADGSPVDPATFCKAGAYRDELKEKNTSFAFGANYKPVDNLLLYANVSRGFKAGSFPTLSAAVFEGFSPVVQEELLSVEGGFKLQLVDNRLSINGAGFFYDYKNKQTRTKFVDPIFGPLDKLINVPKSRVAGVELEITARPIDGLNLSAGLTYLAQAEVTDYEGVIGERREAGLRLPITTSFSGVRLPFAPELQYSVRGDYEFPINTSFNGLIGGGVNGQSKSIAILTVSEAERELYEINQRAIVNGNIGFATTDDRWRVMLWGKNIFNKYYWTSAILAYDLAIRYPARPVEYGLSVAYRF